MRNISILLCFVGTAYHGWQIQKNSLTVAETVETALQGLLREKVRIIGCGRTDAGVHALAYTANFHTESTLPVGQFPPALNARLPHDIRVISAREEQSDFHAIADCVEKEYQYLFYPSRLEDPFLLDRVYTIRCPLDRKAMDSAANALIGKHDFAGFRSLGTEVKSTTRTVKLCVLEEYGSLLRLRIRADGFLYNMARTMAGTVLYAGMGKISVSDIFRIFETGDRSLAGPTLPACGLYLVEAVYERR